MSPELAGCRPLSIAWIVCVLNILKLGYPCSIPRIAERKYYARVVVLFDLLRVEAALSSGLAWHSTCWYLHGFRLSCQTPALFGPNDWQASDSYQSTSSELAL